MAHTPRTGSWRKRFCGKASIAARPLERHVLDEAGAEYNFREAHREAGPVSKVDPSEELLRKMEPLEERLTRLGEMYATGDLGDTEFVSASKEIRAKLDELRAGLPGERGDPVSRQRRHHVGLRAVGPHHPELRLVLH